MDDTIYIFGGRDVKGKDLGDLAAFRLSSMSHKMPLLTNKLIMANEK